MPRSRDRPLSFKTHLIQDLNVAESKRVDPTPRPGDVPSRGEKTTGTETRCGAPHLCARFTSPPQPARSPAIAARTSAILPGISDRPDQLREVVKAAREAGATGVWTNLLFLRPGTREHFLEHLAEDWPEQLEHYLELYNGRAYLQSAETKPLRQQVAGFAREYQVKDRRENPLNGTQHDEQLALAV
jgi:hypothetical protein